jgi:hypothetical protein
MAREIYAFAVTTPAGVSAANPQVVNLTIPPRTVTRIEVEVPAGLNYQAGFRIGASGAPVIPRNAGGWVFANDAHLGWDITGFINSGAWQVFSHNVGIYAHTIQVRLLADPTVAPGAGAFVPLQLTAAGG